MSGTELRELFEKANPGLVSLIVAIVTSGVHVAQAYSELEQSIERNTIANEKLLLLHEQWFELAQERENVCNSD
jgi:hypothetical protein